MKHFFYEHTNSFILISLFSDVINNDISGIKPISLMREEITNGKSHKEIIIEQFKKIYDAADTIYDKRFDDEISNNSNKKENELECFEYFESEDLTQREKALMALWDYAEHELSRHQYIYDEITTVYSCVARGNICLRLSNLYFDNYNLKEADKWGNRANEILWHGKNIIDNNKSNDEQKHKINLLKWLVSFNLGKYYRDYASRNRRSDFLSAVSLFSNIKEEIEKEFQKSYFKNEERRFALLYSETIRNLITISTRRGIKGGIINALKFTKVLCNNCDKSDFKLNDKIKDKIKELEENLLDSDNKSSRTKTIEIKAEIISVNKEYDRKRILLLALLILARNLCSGIDSNQYKKAIELAFLANSLSQDMDNNSIINSRNVNIDALMIISSALRKYCIFSNSQNEDLEKIDEGKNITRIFRLLNEFAGKKHLSSITELMDWYCMSFSDRKRYGRGYLTKVLSWKDYPKSDLINELYENQNKNALLEFYKGKIFLDTSLYSEAEKVFEKLTDPDCEKYNTVTYYVRNGTIGLKTRYLLANAYMAQGKFFSAKCILEEIDGALEVANRLAKNDKDNEYEEVYPDLRILVDLAYCYIKRGYYDNAFNLYDRHYNISKKIKNNTRIITDSFLRNLPKYKRIAGINNLVTCCILNNDPNKRSYGKALLDELEKLNELEKSNLCVEDFFYNPETNLLRGYNILGTKKKNNVACIDYLKVHEFFERSCQKEISYRAQYLSSEKNETDLGALYNNVEYISAYLINIIKLFDSSDANDKNKWATEIKEFIECLPNNRMLSLKAAMALADWLNNYKALNKENYEKNAYGNEYESENDINRLFRYFSYIKIYEERGASAFNNLEKKDNGQFRLFRSVDRGKILARLLVLYKRISTLKEMCTFSIKNRTTQDKNSNLIQKPLVHYTSLNALKSIVKKGKDSSFRLSNCGYANDVYEGHAFFECMENIVSNKETVQEMEKTVQEAGSDVYIASFSLNEDSFPMWTIYSQEETGCNIEFGEGFFDIFGQLPNEDSLLDDYLPSRYMEQDYPLYIVQYIIKTADSFEVCSNNECSLNSNTLSDLFNQIFKEWEILNAKLNSYKNGVSTVKSFAADLINEIRFLFKNADFSYESEVRIVYTDTKNASKTEYDRDIPITYVNMNRNLDNLNITLGSKISYSDADKIETWLKHTGIVDNVKVASSNRKNHEKY